MVRGGYWFSPRNGKTLKVAVGQGDKAKEAQDAGADFVGAEDLVEKIQRKVGTDFDSMVRDPGHDGSGGTAGPRLGPKGLMPNPKVGTVTADVAKAVRELKAGRVEFRARRPASCTPASARRPFGGEKLLDQCPRVMVSRCSSSSRLGQGTYMKSVTLSTTMGPGIKVDVARWSPNSAAK